MKVILFLSFALLTSFELAASLLVNPTRVEVDNKRNRSAVFTLVNKGVNKSRYKVYFEDKKMLPDGTYSKILESESNNSLINFVRYSPRRVDIEPEQAVRVRLATRVSNDIEKGEYRSYIVFHQIPLTENLKDERGEGAFSLKISAFTKVSVPVILSVGELSSDVQIQQSLLSDKEYSVQVTLQRNGTRSTYGDIEIIDKESKEIIGVYNNAVIYTELDYRVFTIPFSAEKFPTSEFIVRYKESNKLNDPKEIEVEVKP